MISADPSAKRTDPSIAEDSLRHGSLGTARIYVCVLACVVLVKVVSTLQKNNRIMTQDDDLFWRQMWTNEMAKVYIKTWRIFLVDLDVRLKNVGASANVQMKSKSSPPAGNRNFHPSNSSFINSLNHIGSELITQAMIARMDSASLLMIHVRFSLREEKINRGVRSGKGKDLPKKRFLKKPKYPFSLEKFHSCSVTNRMSLCGSTLHKELAGAILFHLAHYLVTGFFCSHYFIQPTEQLSHHPNETIPVTVTAVVSITTSIFLWAGTAVAARAPESSVLSCAHISVHILPTHIRAWSAAGRQGMPCEGMLCEGRPAASNSGGLDNICWEVFVLLEAKIKGKLNFDIIQRGREMEHMEKEGVLTRFGVQQRL
ncbi:hypothetical protein DUI87_08994 [Hirundo rustica rustica]|uniref:Uncharacterized protein n=1 Tax=Hirundo rustica rustica TaxID=333673 RepID=A0A3M0KMR8_HIRRU|nr:hypothetical protein DUI87_08994 [Hirundo rustica rustica]